MNLVKEIKELEQEIILKENLHRNEMKELRDKLKTLRDINISCEKCEGKGKLLRRLKDSNEETEVNWREGEKVIC